MQVLSSTAPHAGADLTAILFDMDGVIADSEPLWNEIDGTLLAEYGISYRGEHKHRVLGTSFQIALQFYKDTFNLRAEIEDLALRRGEIAADFYARRIPIFPAAPQVLATLQARGLKIGMATSSIASLALPFLERHDLRRYFDAITTGEEVQHGKPHPDIYLKAARKIETPSQNCLVVEDALSGVRAAKAAQMRVAAIPDARFVDAALYEKESDFLLHELAQLPQLVQNLQAKNTG